MRMQRSDVAGLIDHPQCSEGTFVSCTAPSGASTVRFTRPCIACSCLHALLSSNTASAAGAVPRPRSWLLGPYLFRWCSSCGRSLPLRLLVLIRAVSRLRVFASTCM